MDAYRVMLLSASLKYSTGVPCFKEERAEYIARVRSGVEFSDDFSKLKSRILLFRTASGRFITEITQMMPTGVKDEGIFFPIVPCESLGHN